VPRVNDDPEATPEEGKDAADLARAGKAAALGELTTGVAHELNNPLFAILGLVDFLVTDAEPGSRAHRRLGVVRDTAIEMREVLRAVLDFARESPAGRAPIELTETVRQTVELIRRTSSAKDVELQLQLPSGSAVVVGSRNQVRQSLLHLLANACTAMPGGGTLRVGLECRDGWATVTVTDSGPGVPGELRQRIFEPFFTTRSDGSGLGLAASRAIAESHGGTLELDGHGPGATFRLRLPVADEPGAA
jgi:signal transduction histidine kinase